MNENVAGVDCDIHSRQDGSAGSLPVVSVVIPAYNAATYIAATLDSVLAQSFVEYEIIVVNDGSPDTPAFERALQPYAGRIRYIRQENGGPSSARNAAIRVARGKYLAFLDSDDTWLPRHLQKQVEALAATPSLQMMYANGIYLQGATPVGILFDSSPQSLPVDLDCLLHERSTIITSSAVVSRDAVLRAGLFDEQLRRCEDYDLWLRLAQSGALISFTRNLQIRHRQSNGLAANWELMRHALIQVYEKHLALGTLNPEQTRFVRDKIRSIASAIEFHRAKRALLDGDFTKALASVRSVQSSEPSWKLKVLRIGLQGFPQAVQALYRLHLRRIEQQYRQRCTQALRNAGFDELAPDVEVLADPTLT
jgi:glycosyltransferase involved in cell wall biosynthesis